MTILLVIVLLIGGFLLIWTGIRGDGAGGHNPMTLFGDTVRGIA